MKNEKINSKEELLAQLTSERRKDDSVFTTFFVDAALIDKNICRAAQEIFCSFDIPLEPVSKNGKFLFDKKFYASKSTLLNEYGLVFGFVLYYAKESGDNLKSFLDRFDFAINQYPNHLEFPQMTEKIFESEVTGIFSAKDIRYARDISFAARTFYTCGRAVTWFLSILRPLRISPSAFFADFAEWQRGSSCDYKSGFVPENEKHLEIEKMQLSFLAQKYEEKGKSRLLNLVNDVVKLNGAVSRISDGQDEITIKTSYNPDDLFSAEISDLEFFFENVCLEECEVKIFATEDGIDYRIVK